jgi:hypothetical protein
MHGFCQLVPISLLVLAIIRFPWYVMIQRQWKKHMQEKPQICIAQTYIFSLALSENTPDTKSWEWYL